MTESLSKRIIIIGGGFGGISAARGLANCGAEILLIDRRNHHVFQPLLYQVATAALSPGNIAAPIRKVVSGHRNVRTIMGEVLSLDLSERSVSVLVFGREEKISFDYVILAAGVTTSYFGHPEWEDLAPGLKNVEDALEIRRRFFRAFEQAEIETDPALRSALLTFVIVGGGPTGVELAGAMAEIARKTIAKDFSRIDPRSAKIVIVEGGPRLLPLFHEKLSARAYRDLEDLGVTVLVDTFVTSIDREGVTLKNAKDEFESRVESCSVFWAAGVKAPDFTTRLTVPLDRSGRIVVGTDLAIKEFPNAFVIGDMASARDANGNLVPGLAQGAIQGGAFVAKVIRRDLASPGAPRPAFSYFNKGEMATIGRARAVAQSGGIRLTGLIAWLAWSFVHVLFLIDFRSKILTSLEWIWQYLTFSRGARLITESWRPSTRR